MTLVQITSSDLDPLRALLEQAALPTSDMTEPDRTFFRFGVGENAAYAGIEGRGADRLIRSVVVPEQARGAGIGAKLVKAVERLHLLTNTAEAFFTAQGYQRQERISAPPTIAASREFTSLCPSSAIYLVKEI